MARIEIYTNLLEFRNSISRYILGDINEDGWYNITGIEGQYLYKQIGNYVILVSKDFPSNKLKELEEVKLERLAEVLEKPGNVKYVLTLELKDDTLSTTEELCLTPFPGLDLVNDIIKDFQFEENENGCLSLKSDAKSLKSGIENVIRGLSLYFKIISEQEDIALKVASTFNEPQH
ncbi:hypothetical protein [Stygiolobus caldivivus]|uniref:Uncharacterized protein n=1 Tax=Stygiolobus caldivivus TaxID=2824673 RepID=A0A8D5U5F7_9CREN|nr:hypothetical protein [Stygiolobus caldivivus]BCU69352.1 hypothetical protein KN1_06490 [Stygiolobus caldivivus]